LPNDSQVPTAAVERWVDLATIAKHIGFSTMYVRRMAEAGSIPGTPIRNGSKTYWRFKISLVDAALGNPGTNPSTGEV
jgi:hypothetical protein